ncbi:MAG: hypothetical protein Q9177_006730 [Variospora cf. flavescens]
MGIFNKFHASLLVKDPNDPLVGQEQSEPGPILVNSEYQYEVDEFVSIQRYRRSIKALVKWVGYDDDPQWPLAEVIAQALPDIERTIDQKLTATKIKLGWYRINRSQLTQQQIAQIVTGAEEQ